MTDIYEARDNALIHMPIPHDCQVTELRLSGEVLTLRFEDDVSVHESIAAIHPGARTLTMRFMLTGHDLTACRWQTDNDSWCRRKRKRRCIPGWRQVPLTAVLGRLRYPLDYVAHYVAAGTGMVIVDLCGSESVRLEMTVERVEMERTEA